MADPILPRPMLYLFLPITFAIVLTAIAIAFLAIPALRTRPLDLE
jgi:hypothetical protein